MTSNSISNILIIIVFQNTIGQKLENYVSQNYLLPMINDLKAWKSHYITDLLRAEFDCMGNLRSLDHGPSSWTVYENCVVCFLSLPQLWHPPPNLQKDGWSTWSEHYKSYEYFRVTMLIKLQIQALLKGPFRFLNNKYNMQTIIITKAILH